MVNRKPELTKQEMEGFDNFVKQHYIEMLKQAHMISGVPLIESGIVYRSDREQELAFRAVFDKLATPRVFLIDQWRKLSSEEHMVYSYPDPVEREKAKAEAMRISKQVGEMIQG